MTCGVIAKAKIAAYHCETRARHDGVPADLVWACVSGGACRRDWRLMQISLKP